MTIHTFPSITPNRSSWGLESNTQNLISPFNKSTQTLELAGARWQATLVFNNLDTAEARTMMAFLTKLRGTAGRFYLPHHAHSTPQGIATGTPLIDEFPIINGGFPTNTNGWTAANSAILSVDTARLKIENGAATKGRAYQAWTTIIGQTYSFTVTTEDGTSTAARIYIGEAQFDFTNYTSGVVGAGIHTGTFTATVTTTYITLINDSAVINEYIFFDTVQVTAPSTSVYIDGFTTSQTGILKVGDFIESDDELKMVIEDCDSDSNGLAHALIEPPYRATPTNNAVVTTSSPTAIMRLINDSVAWNDLPGDITSLNFSCIEAYATSFSADSWS